MPELVLNRNDPSLHPRAAEIDAKGVSRLVHEMDWSQTPLGPRAQWPEGLRTLVEMILAHPLPMLVLWGPELVQIYNEGYARIAGSKHPAALGMPTHACWPEARPITEPLYERVMGRGESFVTENHHIPLARDGTLTDAYFTLTLSPIRDGTPAPAGIMLTVVETTQDVLDEREQVYQEEARAASERAVRLSESRFRSMADHLPVMIWITEADGSCTYLSRSWYDFTGQEPATGLGGGWLDTVHPDDRERTWHRFVEATAAATGFRLDYRLRHRDGSYRWAIDSARPRLSPDGRFLGFIGSVLDITDRKMAEEILQASELRYRTLFEAIDEGFCVVEILLDEAGRPADYRFIEANPAFARHTGLVEAVGRNAREAVPNLEQHWIDTYGHIALTGEAQRFEQGSEAMGRWFDVYAFRIGDPAQRRVAILFNDISARRQAELDLRQAKDEAERASNAKSKFLATLSHELRTPLTPVLLTVSLMESHPGLPDDLREEVATIRRNVELESRLISDLLDLTRVTSGKLQIDRRHVLVHPIVRAAIDTCRSQASARLLADLEARHHTVDGDATRLQQVFWNLISNAAKFTDSGDTITVRSRDADGHLRIEIADTGAGIDPEILPRLFSPFEQGQTDSPQQRAGLGLGLAIARQLVEAHGGSIAAHSDGPGRGSTFTVELPTVRDAPNRPKLPVASPPETRQPRSILLIEDHAPTLALMTRLLTALGHRVAGASTVAEAIAVAREGAFDVIVSDLGLPDGSGLDVMRAVGQAYAGRAIAVTGYGMESDIAAAREAGFAAHLTKPVDLTSLSAAIDRLGR